MDFHELGGGGVDDSGGGVLDCPIFLLYFLFLDDQNIYKSTIVMLSLKVVFYHTYIYQTPGIKRNFVLCENSS